jgi:NAD(P)-dependent dehydrogenase (short-subunit alcohol dehydrogenase family)
MASLVAAKTVLITGATGGIGYLAARALLRAGARVALHGRDADRLTTCAESLARDACDAAADASGEPTRSGAIAGLFVSDLASLADTAALAAQVAREVPALDVLVNNAGVGFGSDRRLRERSRDGHELRFAVNYLAPVLLTELLLSHGLPRRAVVNVASIGQEPLDFEDIESARDYEGTRAYRRSKLALIMWSFDLAARHPERVVHALHPGTLLDTQMVRDAGVVPRGPASRGAEVILGVVERALQSTRSGEYFDELSPAPAKPPAYDELARAELRAATLERLRPFGLR